MPDQPVHSSKDIPGQPEPLFLAELFEGPVTFMPETVEVHTLYVPLHQGSQPLKAYVDDGWHDISSEAPHVHLAQSGTRVGWRWSEGALIMRLMFDPGELQRFVTTELRLIGAESRLIGLSDLVDPRICQVARSIAEVLADPRPGQAVMFDAFARMLVVHMVRSYLVAQKATSRGGLSAEIYDEILTHIDTRISEPIRITDLSDLAHMSESAFLRAIKTTTGQTPHELVRDRRLEAVRRLLQGSDLSLGQIASATGFADQAHLSRSFKRAFGQSPSQWRRIS